MADAVVQKVVLQKGIWLSFPEAVSPFAHFIHMFLYIAPYLYLP